MATSATGVGKSRSETRCHLGNSETTPLATSAKGSQRAGKSERAREGEGNAATGGAAKLLIVAAKLVGKSLGRQREATPLNIGRLRQRAPKIAEVRRKIRVSERLGPGNAREFHRRAVRRSRKRHRPANLGRVGGWEVGTRERGNRSCGCAEKSRSQTGCHLGDRSARYGTKTPSC